ncbi:MAG: TerC family protein [Bacteriovoracaceae bacterium]|nr:TerC family protein [Bacteriovoracaceae bacterium]
MLGVHSIWEWAAFAAIIGFMLVLDLGVFHKKSHKVSIKESLAWTAIWITLSLMFNAWIFHSMGEQKGLEFLSGYVIEKSLSVDNIFVISLIFSYFRVPPQYQHRVLFWGVLGALVFRIIFIFAGVALIQKFNWMIYVFGGFLVITGLKMLREEEKTIEIEANPLIRFIKKFAKISPNFDGEKFRTILNGKKVFTPLFLVLVMIETTDIIFAVDSIPAVLAITSDPYIVFTSNVFAILGLRSLYFALNGVMEMFEYINYALAGILVFVGVKMIISPWFHMPTIISVGVIFTLLLASILASIYFPKKNKKLPKPQI